jgi:predicted DNA-binding transcriptional regulator AlpA
MRAQKFHLMQNPAGSAQKEAPVEQTVESAADRLMKITEAAQFLAVEPTSLYHMVSQGRVPCIRLSKRCLRFRMADLKHLIDQKFVPAK